MTTWFLFLFIGLFFAWMMLWIGTSIVNDSSSPLTCAAGLKHKDFTEESPLWNEIQSQFGQSLKKAGMISLVIMMIGMLFLIRMEQVQMISIANCLLGIEILAVLFVYVQNLRGLKQKLQTQSIQEQQDVADYEIIGDLPYEEDVPSVAEMDLERLEQSQKEEVSKEDSKQEAH